MSKFPEDTEMRISKKFRERIRDLIEENDCVSNKQFAVFVGVSIPVITKAANFGIIPSTKILIKIADKLDVSILYLLGIEKVNDFIGSGSPSSFHVRVQELARERNETFGRIASKLPFPRTYFYDWIKENNLPTVEYAIMIAEYFNVSLDYLLGRTDYRK